MFIDELYTVVGAGSSEADARQARVLARELHIVGATTLDEYRENTENDPAFERRFHSGARAQRVDTVSILRNA